MNEHDAPLAADEATTPPVGVEGMDAAAQTDDAAPSAPKRRRRGDAEHPSLFAINLEDPELPSHTMPFHLRVEAAILLADRPISDARIAEVLGLVHAAQRGAKDAEPAESSDAAEHDSSALAARRREAVRLVREAVDLLNKQYAEANRTFRIESVSG